MKQKRVLIPGGKTSDWALVDAAHKLGLYVITSGYDKNAPAHKFSDEYVCADYSDKNAMLELAKSKEIDYMCSSANDISMVTTAYVCEKIGLPGHDSYEIALEIHHKDRFKKLSKKLNLHVPDGMWFDNESEALEYALSKDYKLIIKPSDLVGGNGVSTASSPDEKKAAISKAFNLSLGKTIVIEKFITGTSHSFSAFLVDGKIAFYYSDNEYSFYKPFYVSTSAGPADNIESVKDILISDSEKLAQYLNLVDGRFHIQYILGNDGMPYILEITRRTSGDLYSVPESSSLGINTPDWVMKAECGISCKDYPKGIIQKGFYGRHCIFALENKNVKNIFLDDELENHVYKKLMLWQPGKTYHDNCAGLLFWKFDSHEQVLKIINRIKELIKFEFYDTI